MVQTLVENLTSQDFLLDISTSQSDTAPDLVMTEGYLGNNRLRTNRCQRGAFTDLAALRRTI